MIAGTTDHCWPFVILEKAVKQRNKMLDSLAESSAPHAWFIVCEPLAKNRAWWSDKLSAEIIVIETPAAICESRIAFNPERARQEGAGNDWWSKYTRSPFDKVIAQQ
jgi:hypothetical protein